MKHSIVGLDISNKSNPRNLDEFSAGFSLNSGNLLFHYATETIIDLSIKKHSWLLSGANKKNGCSGLIIPMANQLGSHIDLSKGGPKISSVDVPMVVLGIGAQFKTSNVEMADEIPSGTIEWLNKVSESAVGERNIAVRGRFTRDILQKLGFGEKVEVTGCQSNFISRERSLGEKIFKKYQELSKYDKEQHFCVTAGDYHKKDLHDLERSLISLIDGKRGCYIVQNPKHLIALANGWADEVPTGSLQAIQSAWLPQVDLKNIAEWFRYHSSVYISVPQWLLDMSKKSMVVGTRIHGVQAALQAGTPALCLCIDSRTRELCSLMSIPHIDAHKYSSGITKEDCFFEFEKWDYKKYDEIRITLARRMKNFLISNKVTPSKHLLYLTS